MNKRFPPFIAFLMLAIVIMACDLPIPLPVPPGGATATPPFSPEQLGTAVAMTLTAAVPGGADPTATSPDFVTPGATALLPHSFYYLGTDSAGLLQVFRIETDGMTQHQVTS